MNLPGAVTLVAVAIVTIFLWMTLYRIIRASEKPTAGAWLGAGLVTGLAAITRADILGFAVVVSLLAALGHREDAGRVYAWRSSLAFAVGVLAPLLLVGARNETMAGRFSPWASELFFYPHAPPHVVTGKPIRPQ